MRVSAGRSWALVAAVIMVAAAAEPAGQRRRAVVPNSTLPVATDVVNANPDAFYGKQVTISAGVDQVLSKTVFTVDQRKVAPGTKSITALGTPVLVIAPTLSGELDQKNYMLFVGELLKFDQATIAEKAKDYKWDLAPDALAKFNGRPVLLARAVIDSQHVDQAKRPMTAEEKALSAVMRRISGSFTAMRRATDGTEPRLVTETAAALKLAFTETEPFWKQRPDAMQWARDARQQADIIEREATAGKLEAAKASAESMNKVCQSCHTAYREPLDDGTFRIRAGK